MADKTSPARKRVDRGEWLPKGVLDEWERKAAAYDRLEKLNERLWDLLDEYRKACDEIRSAMKYGARPYDRS